MKITPRAQSRLANLQMLVMDVDGVLTQGDVMYTDAGHEIKSFDVRDGLGLRVASEAGLKLAIVSGRTSPIVQRRARDLHITDVVQRCGDKELVVRALAAQYDFPLERVAYIGDDLNDRAPMRIVGIAIAPADAATDILETAEIVTDAPSGRGAVRQAVELILRTQGTWEAAVQRYLGDLAEKEKARLGVSE